MSFINKRNIYGNEYNACALCEYQRELKLIKRLINIAEKAIEQQASTNAWSYEVICHSFAKTIVDYSKMAYDNVLLGHLHAVNMIIRTVLENLVCLDIIVNNRELELWKYYWAYSYSETIYKSGRTPAQDQLDFLQSLYNDLNISEDFYVKQGENKKAYIQKPYGWTYKINLNKQFTFKNICKLADSDAEYHGFSLMSDYSHGTSFYTKMYSSVFVGDMMVIFVNLYMNLYRMVTMYCLDKVDEDFDDVTDELDRIFNRFLQYEEGHFGSGG